MGSGWLSSPIDCTLQLPEFRIFLSLRRQWEKFFQVAHLVEQLSASDCGWADTRFSKMMVVILKWCGIGAKMHVFLGCKSCRGAEDCRNRTVHLATVHIYSTLKRQAKQCTLILLLLHRIPQPRKTCTTMPHNLKITAMVLENSGPDVWCSIGLHYKCESTAWLSRRKSGIATGKWWVLVTHNAPMIFHRFPNKIFYVGSYRQAQFL